MEVVSEVPELPPLGSLPPEVQRLRTDRERRFVWYYMLGGANGSEAARAAGYPDSSEACKVRAHELLHREDVKEALTALGHRYLFNLMPKALVRLNALLENPKHREHGKAIDRVLNRVPGFGERSAVDVNVSGEVTHNHTDAALNDLRSLLALGVPRAELERTFGVSGLQRYERMLAEKDGKRAPLMIEGEVVSRETS